MPGFSWFSLIDCGVALALLEDKQSLEREDCNVMLLINRELTEDI